VVVSGEMLISGHGDDVSPARRAIDKRSLLLRDNERLSTTDDAALEWPAVTADPGPDLRQMRTFVAVAERHSFTLAADDLHIAQQAVSQQIKALERSLGVTLLRRSSRRVELTTEGRVFLADCVRVVSTVEHAVQRVRAASRGETGTLRIVYTLASAWDTVPRLLERLGEVHPQLKIEAREVFGAEVAELLVGDRCDLALAPMTAYPKGLHTEIVRREPLRAAVAASDPLAGQPSVELAQLSERRFELWQRAMAPGFYDSVLAACHAAGFEPRRNEQAAGNTVWRSLARGPGVALVNDSLREQMPGGVVLVPLAAAAAPLMLEAVWRRDDVPAISTALDVARALAAEHGWLDP